MEAQTKTEAIEKMAERKTLLSSFTLERADAFTFVHGVRLLTPVPTRWGWVAFETKNDNFPGKRYITVVEERTLNHYRFSRECNLESGKRIESSK